MRRRNLEIFSVLILIGFIAAAITWSWLNSGDPVRPENRMESSHSTVETDAFDAATERNSETSADSNPAGFSIADETSVAAASGSESADEEWSAYVESVIVRHISASGLSLIRYEYNCDASTCRVLLVPATSKVEPSELAPLWGRMRTIASEIVADSDGALQGVSIRAHTDSSQSGEQNVEFLFNRYGEQSTFTIDMPSQTVTSPACSSLPAQSAFECLLREGRAAQESEQPQVIVIE